MTIHHATIKRAASLGVVLTDEGDTALAHHTERNKRIENDDPKAALAFVLVAAKLALEYPAIEITNDGEAQVDGDTFYTIDPDAKLEDTIAELLEAAAELDTGEVEDEEGSGKVVVAQRYKDEYRARGDASGCGDWLFQQLKRYTTHTTKTGAKGGDIIVHEFDDTAFTDMLSANGVVIEGKFAALRDDQAKGWQGRYKMNGRQKLEIPVLQTGVLVLEDGETIKMPRDEREELGRKKHKALWEEIETQEEEAKVAATKARRKAK